MEQPPQPIIPILTLIRDHEGLRSENKFLLMILASYDTRTGVNIFPSVSTLAKLTGYDDRWIKRILKELRDDGYITATGIHQHSRTTIYKIEYERLLLPPSQSERKKWGKNKKVEPVMQPKYSYTREEIHAKLEAALAKKERAQHP